MDKVSSFAASAAAAVAGLIVAGCRVGEEIGSAFGVDNGPEKTEQRTVATFRAVRLAGAASVEVKVGEAGPLEVTGPEKSVDNLETVVEDGVLVIRQKESFRSHSGRLKVVVPTSTLDQIDLSGAGDIKVHGVDTERFALNLTGAGNAELHGKATRLEARLSGAGNVAAFDLEADEVRASASGAGNIEVTANKTADFTVSGVGNVSYKGDPVVTKTVSGVGSVGRA